MIGTIKLWLMTYVGARNDTRLPHIEVHECHWPWVQELARACRTLKWTRVSLTVGAKSGTRLPRTEMYTSVTGRGCKKWQAPAPRWKGAR